MKTQTYYHTKFQEDANRRNDMVPLQVNCVGAVGQDNSFDTEAVRHDFYYIYVLEGKMVMPECTLMPGEVIVLEPECPYRYSAEGDTTYLWVHYTGFEAKSQTKAAFMTPGVKCRIGIREELVDCFRRLFKEFIINDEASGKMEVYILEEILALTGRYAGAERKSNMPLEAIEYIHRHFKENADMEKLAQLEHKSYTAFRNAFREHTGVSPNEYIITQRISEACRLLTQTAKSVREVAADVGYADQYYFSRIFKKKMGMPPLKYRQKAQRLYGKVGAEYPESN